MECVGGGGLHLGAVALGTLISMARSLIEEPELLFAAASWSSRSMIFSMTCVSCAMSSTSTTACPTCSVFACAGTYARGREIQAGRHPSKLPSLLVVCRNAESRVMWHLCCESGCGARIWLRKWRTTNGRELRNYLCRRGFGSASGGTYNGFHGTIITSPPC